MADEACSFARWPPLMKPDNAHIDLKGVALLIILCASWGLNQVAIKVAIKVGIAGVPPVLQAGIRSTGSAFLVLLWMVLRGWPVLKRDGPIWWGILVGILFSVEFILIYWGLEFTNASRSVIFLNTSPFVVALGEGGIRELNPVVTASLIYQIIWVAFITFAVHDVKKMIGADFSPELKDIWYLPVFQI